MKTVSLEEEDMAQFTGNLTLHFILFFYFIVSAHMLQMLAELLEGMFILKRRL
jgi:hypothetical protein